MFALPEWIDPDVWQGFEEMRRKIRKPLTDYARRLIVRQLERIWREYHHPPAEVLEQSIMLGYQGVFPLKQFSPRETHVGAAPRGAVKDSYLKRFQ